MKVWEIIQKLLLMDLGCFFLCLFLLGFLPLFLEVLQEEELILCCLILLCLNGYLNNVQCIYAIGEVTDRIETYAKENNIECKKCYKLSDALSNIFMNVKAGDIVLLSPASASQDQYKRFEDRGDEFKSIVNTCKSK